MWDAIVAWRDNIYQADFFSNTKSNYLTSMLKLIETGIIDVRHKLSKIDESWLIDAKRKIDSYPEWSASTKSIRKSCLNTFYSFIKKWFDYEIEPYRRHPEPNEIHHVLSIVREKALTADISPIDLFDALTKINKRDAYIVLLMISTKKKLESILDCRKENLRISYMPSGEPGGGYLDFDDIPAYVHPNITPCLDELRKNSTVYLFETARGKKIRRTQVTRNLKQAGRNIGLDFDLTPKILHGYVMAYMSEDKRDELERALQPF